MRTDRWPEAWPIRLIQLLAVPGLLIAFYLLLYHNGDLIAACKSSGWDDCGKVSGPDGAYSSVGPFPVALIGLIGYAVIFLVAWLKDWWPLLEDYMPEIMVGLTSVAFLFSCWPDSAGAICYSCHLSLLCYLGRDHYYHVYPIHRLPAWRRSNG